MATRSSSLEDAVVLQEQHVLVLRRQVFREAPDPLPPGSALLAALPELTLSARRYLHISSTAMEYLFLQRRPRGILVLPDQALELLIQQD
jgi:hypothetical protein